GVIWYVLCHHRSGTDEGIASNGDATDDGAVSPQSGAALHECAFDFVHATDLAARIDDVCKDHRRAAKDGVFERHAFVNRDIVLDLHLVADADVGTDHDVLANPTIPADSRPPEQV